MTDESLSFRLLAILFPIFGIVAAGYFYARHHKPEMAVANRLNMDVFARALVFAAMAGKSFDLAAFAPLALGALLVLATCGLLAWPLGRLFGIQAKTLVPPMTQASSAEPAARQAASREPTTVAPSAL